jgi:hypothetical protein
VRESRCIAEGDPVHIDAAHQIPMTLKLASIAVPVAMLPLSVDDGAVIPGMGMRPERS